ncbi:hypothetical protein DH2020_014227 [Rehmannia glutinosa]|uniref:WRKY domain-containing protein n=1 Tax=Rehmannia glutinosa TaxID=99300 RepID=A0ABR0WVS9_REHGL
MEEESNRNFEALQETENENCKSPVEGEEEFRDEKMENNDEQRRVSSDSRSDCAVGNSSRGESKASKSKTLTSVQLSEEVPVEYSLQPLQSAEESKVGISLDQVRAEHDKSLKVITGASTEVQIQVPVGPSKLEVSPTSVTKSISSIPNPSPAKQKLHPVENENKVRLTEQDKQNSPDPKPLSVGPMLKTPDGYNWRKYGQKQVKSPEGSRSYYRCTFSDCYAKKIECSDRSNRLIETVYRSHHNHDPPQKVNCTRENKPALPIVPVNGSNDATHPARCINDQVQANPSKQPLLENEEIPETKKQESSDSDETTEINMEEQKRNSIGELGSNSKPGKKPKYVVHAAGDVGISGDGYRWRKYGQKMVKGNPHPRNYYRCTSAGCPVRKHIERAVDNVSAVVITYKGVHDHDIPVPRKRHSPKSAIADDLQNRTKQSRKSQTQWSVDKEGELTGEPLNNVVGEKASESARTLLSIGFEIKPC